ncbi:UDP-3-O-acylglucosamine N-acyltransferase [Frankliniella fusca]|uniref:UDP-3-O-acylglucosamine N-acyltransferase n=1 Tax=Frankliniella fusca TaxID=407009 RepID=A0AAE1HTS4_9NEOP|nr:UDP-3-O-acylglucosamine N-acyltransferase [Frankliniella fusca]
MFVCTLFSFSSHATGELCAKSVAGKMDSATEKPTEIFSNPHEAVSSSEEENIVLRAQSKILRENQSNSSRATKSPKIINTEAQGLHSQFLGKRLRFSAVLQSPPKHSAKDIQEKNDAQTPILSNCIRFDKSLTPKHECNTSLQKECNNSSDSSFDVGVLVSRNPIDVSKTHDDSFELEIMSSSADELKHFNEKTKHVADSLHNVQEKTKVKKGGSSSSRVKEMRQRKEARIEALLNSYADDSDCESQGTAPPTVKDGLEPGSGKKSQKDKIAFGARRPGQFRKAIRKNQNKEREMSAESPPSSQERVPWTTAPLNLDDNHFLSGQPQEKCETQETAIEKTNAQSGGVSKQLENLDIKTGKGNRAIKIGSKESTKQEFQEKDIINPTSSQENFPLTEPMYLNDNYFLNEKPEEKRHTQENVFVPRKSLSGGDTKQLKDLYFKSGKRNRAMKMPTKKLTIKSSERRDICPSMPNKTNGEEVSSKRCSQRVRRPPSMYWLGRRTQISTLHTEDEVLTQKNPSPSQAMTDIDMLDHGYDGQKSKGQKRKALQPKKNKNIKVSKKKKSSESEQSSEHNELQSSLPEKIYIGRAKKDVSCSKNEVQEFRCVQGSGVKGDILALGVGAKYENVFYNQNQVFYLLEGDISYECSNEKATLASGSFFIVPHGQHFIITNISNSTTKLVVATSRL